MSEVLAIIEPGTYGTCVRLWVKCAGCSREYATTQTQAAIRRAAHCKHCTPSLKVVAQSKRCLGKVDPKDLALDGRSRYGSRRWARRLRELPPLSKQRVGFT